MIKNILAAFLVTISFFLQGQNIIDVEGPIKLGNTSLLDDGLIRFTGSDFQGRVGGNWQSLLNSSGSNSSLWTLGSNSKVYRMNNVGIGITDPLSVLHIKGNAGILNLEGQDHAYIQFFPDGYSTGRRGWLGWGGATSSTMTINNQQTGGSLDLKTQNTSRIFINSAGAVGIGTSDPLNKLDVNGTIRQSHTSSDVYTSISTYKASGTNGNIITQIDPKPENSSSSSTLRLFRSVNTSADVALAIFKGNNTTNTSHILRGKGSSSLAINSDQNIGIGITSPSYKLHVDGDTYVNGGWLRVSGSKGLFFQSYGGGWYMKDTNWIRSYGNKSIYHNTGIMRTDGTLQVGPDGNRFVVRSDGKVGIGTTAPVQKLQVIGTTRSGLSTTEYTDIGHGGSHGFIDTRGDGNLEFRHDGNTKMLVQSSGKVVVGSTNTPTPGNYKLYVEDGILTEVVKVAIKSEADWSDDAFDRVPSIEDMERSIVDNSHLIGMPSAKELVNKGYSVTDMDAKLLEQIEWLTLYVIELKKEIQELKKNEEN